MSWHQHSQLSEDPPSYDKQKSRRYPVVYALNSYSIGTEQWIKEIHLP